MWDVGKASRAGMSVFEAERARKMFLERPMELSLKYVLKRRLVV